MKAVNEIQLELNEMGVRLPISAASIQSIPEGYFDSFYDGLRQRIQDEDTLAAYKQLNPYTIPGGYFEDFDHQLLARIRQEEFLDTLPAELPYQVPSGYFNEMDNRMMAIVGRTDNAPRLAPLRSFYHTISIAATLLLFLGLAFKGMLFPIGGHRPVNAEAQLAGLTDTEISAYLSDHEAEVANSLALENMDDSHLDLNSVEADVLDHALDAVNDDELLNYPL